MTFKEFNDQRDESAFALARLRRDVGKAALEQVSIPQAAGQ